MRRLLLLAMLLSFFVGSAQTLQRSEDANPRKTDSTKYTPQIKTIVDSYDQTALADLFVVNDAKERAEKQDALAYALVKNIPVKRYNPDGSFDELQKIAVDGTPIYYTLHNVNAAISTRANFLNTGGGLGLTVDGNENYYHPGLYCHR